MTPRQQLSAKIEGLPVWKRRVVHWMAIATAGLTLVAAMRPIWRPAVKDAMTATLDSVYVRQQSYERDTFRDSLTHRQETDSIFRMLRADQAQHARTDSSLRCLRKRKPGWCD